MNSKPLSKALRRLKDCTLRQMHTPIALLLIFAITTQSVRAENTAYVEGQVIAQFKEPLPYRLNPQSGEKEAYTLMADYPSLQFQFIHPTRTQLVLISGDSVENLIALFQDHPDIVFVEPNYKQSLRSIQRSRSQIPNDALYSLQWALENSTIQGDGLDVDFVDAWELSRDLDPNQPILIAVIDSNIAINHPDLKINSGSTAKKSQTMALTMTTMATSTISTATTLGSQRMTPVAPPITAHTSLASVSLKSIIKKASVVLCPRRNS